MAHWRGSGVPKCNVVPRMPLATIALFCKRATANFRTRHPPELPMAPSIGLPVIICYSLEHMFVDWSIQTGCVASKNLYNRDAVDLTLAHPV